MISFDQGDFGHKEQMLDGRMKPKHTLRRVLNLVHGQKTPY